MRDEKEKQRIVRKEKVLVNTALYLDYCEEDKDHRQLVARASKEYRIRINNRLYRLKWWNGAGSNECTAISLCIGNETREHFYMRFKHEVDGLLWYVMVHYLFILMIQIGEHSGW